MNGWIPRLTIALGRLTYSVSAASIVLLCVMTVVDTASRTFGSGSIALVFDVNETLIVLVAFLCLAYAALAGEHVAFTAIYDRLPERGQYLSRLIGYLLALPLIGWMAWVSFDAALTSWQTAEARMGVAQLPVWPARLAVAVGLLAFFLTLVYGALAVIRRWPEFPLRTTLDAQTEKEIL